VGLFPLEPFDNIFVRYVPEFELQQNVTIEGEVTLPGEYSLVKENETVSELIRRAGGLTEESFAQAATLYRSEDSLGYIVMRLDEVLTNPSSRYNYVLKQGDIITIPKKKDYVVIEGATQLERSQSEQIIGKGNSIRVPYHAGEDALFYINYYAGGFADDARKDKIFVLYPNGEVKTSEKRFLIGKKHPEVLPGSIIQVGKKKLDLYGKDKKEDINWTRVLGDSVAQAMSILTLILLVQRLD
jgi:protein involved in polysaccharide export with SLBB domain